MTIQRQIEEIASQMNLGPELDREDCWTGGIQKQKIILFREGFVVVQPFLHNFQWRRPIHGDRHGDITAITARFVAAAIEGGLLFSYYAHREDWHGTFLNPGEDYFATSERFVSPSPKLFKQLSQTITNQYWQELKENFRAGQEIIFGRSFDGVYKISQRSIGDYSLDGVKEVRLTVDSDEGLSLLVFPNSRAYRQKIHKEIEALQGRPLTERELLKLEDQGDYAVMAWDFNRIYNPHLLFRCLEMVNIPIAGDAEAQGCVEMLKEASL